MRQLLSILVIALLLLVIIPCTGESNAATSSSGPYVEANFGWAKTWGGSSTDGGGAAAMDGSGNVYVTGGFSEIVDFDPGPGEGNHTSNGYTDVFLSKFDSSGNFLWAKTWGGDYYDKGCGITVDASGSVYVTGDFLGTFDFDPGIGVDNHTSNGVRDIFLTKFDSSGAFLWAQTWGGDVSNDHSSGVAADSLSNVYVTGSFEKTVDFDPGSDVDNHTSSGIGAFLSKFNSSGDFLWAKTWGKGERAEGNAVATDNSGNVYVTGGFAFEVDFDPGPGVDNHEAQGEYCHDTFLSKFDSSGNFLWAKILGGHKEGQEISDVATDSSNNVYMTGYYTGTVDFDPGPGEDWHTHFLNGSMDTFISKLDSSGNFLWAKTWGGMGLDEGTGVIVDASDNIYVTGVFPGTVDFDPGSGVDNHTSNGEENLFLSKFDSSGNFLWAKTWGGSDTYYYPDKPSWICFDSSSGVAVDASGNVYVTGYFHGTVDFDPGLGEGWHTSNGGFDVFLSKFMPE